MAEKGWSRVGGRGTSRDHPSSARRRGNPAGTVWGKRFCQPSGAGAHFLEFRQRLRDKATAVPKSKLAGTRRIQPMHASRFAPFYPSQRHFNRIGAFVNLGNRDVRITCRDSTASDLVLQSFRDGGCAIAPARDEDISRREWKMRAEPTEERAGVFFVLGNREN